MTRIRGSLNSQGALPLSLAPTPASVFVGRSNQAAVAAVLERAWTGALYLEGPPKSGKSHLAAVFAARAGAARVAAAELDAERAAQLADIGAVAIDGLESLRPGGEEALFHLFNAILRQNGQLLLTGRVPPRGLSVALKDLATRLHSVPVARIGPPDERDLEGLLTRLAEARQLALPPPVLAYLLPRMPRTHAAAINLMEALDRLSLETGCALSRELAAEALKTAET
ncbi:MAG: DnaA/Hda family protein [Alphaproteobacteria bacterium]